SVTWPRTTPVVAWAWSDVALMSEASAANTALRLTREGGMRGSPGAGGIRGDLLAPTGGKNSGRRRERPARVLSGETEISALSSEIGPIRCGGRASHPVPRVQERDVSIAL